MHIPWPWALEFPEQVGSGTNWLIVRGIGFLLFLFVFWKLVVPVIAQSLTDRRSAIVNAAEQIEETKRETEQMRNEYRLRLEQIEDEAELRMSEAIREAEALREQLLTEAGHNAEIVVRRGQEEVERERAKALLQLRTQFIENTIRAAQYAAARSLDSTAQRRLVDEFAQKVGTPS